MRVLVEEEGREEGWVSQFTKVKRKVVKYLDKIFNRHLRNTQHRRKTDILEVVEIEKHES